MDKKRILYVSQEIHPYLPENEISKASLEYPKKMNELGHEVRIFMPRYGLINERRHQLHEVIRLSGINIIINDMDQPLIIKVASVPQARLQVYFIDNDEFFKRKALFYNEKGEFFSDNDQRAIFFCRGVIETVKKLGWSPDIIHCHGWMASFMPLYIKMFHHDDPLFEESKMIVSVYESKEDNFTDSLVDNLKFDGINGQDISKFENININKLYLAGADYSDGVIINSNKADDSIVKELKEKSDNFLNLSESENPIEDIYSFYEQINK